MRLKYKIKTVLQFVAFAFYPKTALIACAVFSVVMIGILGVMMAAVPKESVWYNFVFALTTGAAGSFFVSFVVELAGNYRHNKVAWYELQEYYATVMNYESRKQIMMQMAPHQWARRKLREAAFSAGDVDGINEFDKPKDRIQVTWEQLPDLIPIFRQTLNEKKEFLSDIEIETLKHICSKYEQIQFFVQERIWMSPITYDALNHPDEDFLKIIYPADVIKNMPEWIKKNLSSKESEKACKIYAEAILSDAFLLSQFMRDYEISQNGLDSYQNALDRMEKEEEREDEDIDTCGYSESAFPNLEGEEVFRAKNEKFDKQMELKQRPFVSWQISECCQQISESVDILEKSILKKPYYGWMIEHYKNFAKELADDE